MKAERQGMAGIYNRVNSRWHVETLMFVFAFLAVLFHVPSFAACTSGDYGVTYSSSQLGFVSQSYGYCRVGSCGNTYSQLPYCYESQVCTQGVVYRGYPDYDYLTDCSCSHYVTGVCQTKGANDSFILRCRTRCTTECQANENICNQNPNKIWDAATCTCNDKPPECKTKFCCDSLNQNLPVKTDTLWLGCVASDPSSDKCVVYSSNVTPGDTTLNAECNGKSRYRVCTEMWMWSESAKQCAPLPTRNCIEYDVQDSMCSNVICSQTQQHELSALDYNNLTQCYTGKETVRSILICSNGLREPGTEYTRDFKVCRPFLDSLGIDIDDYISGGSGASGYGWGGQSSGGGIGGGSGGSGGGEGGGGSGGGSVGGAYGGGGYGGDSDGNGMGDAYQGGPGVDAQGDSVYNSPSPGLGGTWTPMPTVVTETDSNGNVTIVKNSQGGDSITTQNIYTEIRCLGVHNGIATMTNGLNTWTCEASSCSQATLSASIYGGACSGQRNGVGPSETNPSLPTINGDDGWNLTRMAGDIQKMLTSLERFNADVNANSIVERRKQDSIAQAQENMWKVTFGSDFSYISTIKDGVVNLGDGLSSLQSVNSQGFSAVVDAIRSASSQQTNVNVNVDLTSVVNAVNSASSQNSVMLSHVMSAMQESIHSASSLNTASIENAVNSNRNAIASAASANRNAIYSAASDIVASNDRIRIMVASNTSSVNDVKSAVNAQGQNIVDAINGLTSASSNNGGIVDTVHHTNQILESIEGAVVDTGKNIPRSIWSLDSTVHNLPSRMDSVMSRNMSAMQELIISASSLNSESIASATSANRDAMYSAASEIIASNDRIRITVMSNTSSVEDVKSAVNSHGQNIVDALNNMVSASSNNGGIVDTVHHTNQILESIENAVVDTGKNIPASIWSLDSTVYNLPMRFDSMTRISLDLWSDDKLVMIIDSNARKVVDAIESLHVDVHLDSISYIVQHDTILDSINNNLKTKGNYALSQVNDTLNFEKYFRQGYDSAIVDTSFDNDTSFMGFFHGQQYVDGSVFDGNGNVDSVTNVVNQKLDSSQVAHNARSDSLTRAYADTMLKYSGMDSTSAALRRLFNQPNNGCPRECIDISLVFPGRNQRVEINFSTYICDMKIFGNLSVLDFIKVILRLMTSILSVMMIWSAVGKRKQAST